MSDIICINSEYSTTRRVTRAPLPTIKLPDSKFDPILDLPPMLLRKGYGGLRRQGYFKARFDSIRNEEGTMGETAPPLITIVTAVFNGDKTLEKSILSVINQSYSNIEYIIIDGGSTDGSLDIIKKYDNVIDYWVCESDAGIYDAWNKGVRLASGDWVAFLGADDIYVDGAIQAYVDFITRQPNNALEFISSKINLTRNSKVLRTVGARWSWNVLRKYMTIAQVGAMHHRTLFEKYGLFDDTYRISGDYEFLLRPGPNLQADFLNSVTVNMEVGGVSDANIQVFTEVAKAKIITANRSTLLCHLEKYWAIFKWKLRNYLST